MNLKKFIVTVLLLCNCLVFNVKAADTIPTSNVYKEGIYHIKDELRDGTTAELISENSFACILIVNDNGVTQIFKQFGDYHEKINIGNVSKNSTIVVIGDGELAINFHN